MSYHTEIMLFEILYLNYNITKSFSINKDLLEEAFYNLQDIINNNEDLAINNIFDQELDNFIEQLPDYISVEEDEVIINDDLDIIFDELIQIYPTLTEIDYDIQEYVHNLIIYNSLNLPIPLTETKELFDLNRKIIQLYLIIAEQDFNNKNNLISILYLKNLINQFKDILNKLDDTMLNKIKMCCAYYNNEYLEDEKEYFINSDWSIILFSNKTNQIKSLSYNKLEYMCEMIDKNVNEEDELLINEYLKEFMEEEELEIEEVDYNEMSIFLSHYFIKLNK